MTCIITSLGHEIEAGTVFFAAGDQHRALWVGRLYTGRTEVVAVSLSDGSRTVFSVRD